jgi:predicted RNase H-like HicB family nuclease
MQQEGERFMDVFNFTGIILKEDEGFSSLCLELDVASQGDTSEEAKEMLLEAVTLYLEGAFEDGLPYLRPVPSDADPRLIAPHQIIETFHFKVNIAVHAYA